MKSFTDTLVAINTMKAAGVIEEYAVAGAMALLFWTEPVPTFHLDVLVFLPPSGGPLVSLDAILVEDVPTQFVPSPNPLADEAIRSAANLDYNGVAVRVVRPEYLVALYLDPAARTPKRRERAAALLELPSLNRALVDDILQRYGLSL